MQDLQDFKNNQPYQDNNENEEAEMPLEEHEEALLPELGDSSFEAENEVPLIPCRKNKAEDSTTKDLLYPPSVEYANASPLEAKETEGKKPSWQCSFSFFKSTAKLPQLSWKLLASLWWEISTSPKT